MLSVIDAAPPIAESNVINVDFTPATSTSEDRRPKSNPPSGGGGGGHMESNASIESKIIKLGCDMGWIKTIGSITLGVVLVAFPLTCSKLDSLNEGIHSNEKALVEVKGSVDLTNEKLNAISDSLKKD